MMKKIYVNNTHNSTITQLYHPDKPVLQYYTFNT